MAGRFLTYTDSPVWRYAGDSIPRHDDPRQDHNLTNDRPAEAARMRELMVAAMRDLETPRQPTKSRRGCGNRGPCSALESLP